MGNSNLPPLKNEDKHSELLLEYNWLKESGSFVDNNRISYNYKVTDSSGDYLLYRFFPGIKSHKNEEASNVISDLYSDNTNKSLSIDRIIIESELKYHPCLNGLNIDKIMNTNIAKSITNVLDVIELENKLADRYFCPNIIFFRYINGSDNFYIFAREMWESTIKDELDQNLYENNEINNAIKKWLEFQSIMTIFQLQIMDVFHGDIKTENMLINHIFTIKLTDISPWKPIFIDRNDLRLWTTFFERYNNNMNVKACNISPERFITKDEIYELQNIDSLEFKERLRSMDMFSLGCVLREIESGSNPFSINDILKIRDKNDSYQDFINMLFSVDWKKRPSISNLFLSLSNVDRYNIVNFNLYLLNFNSTEAKFCKSFLLFFYPLSIILQSKIFCDIKIQLLILNMSLPVLLELFVIESIEFERDNSCELDLNNNMEIYLYIFSLIKLKHKSGWKDSELKRKLQSVFDFDLERDLIFYIILLNLNDLYTNDNYFDTYCFENEKIDNSYLNIKGFFSLFQLLLNQWDCSNGMNKFLNEYEMNKIFIKIIFESSYYIYNNINNLDSNRGDFIQLIKNELSSQDVTQPIILFIMMILNSLERMNYNYIVNDNDLTIGTNEMVNSINLLTIHTMKFLLEILPTKQKLLLLNDKILPFFFHLLSINVGGDDINNCSQESHLIADKKPLYNLHDTVVVIEMFNIMKDYIYLIEKVREYETCLAKSYIVSNIESWIRHYSHINASDVVTVLLKIFHKVINLVQKSGGSYKICDWVPGILTSGNSVMKLVLLNINDCSNQSLIFEVISFYTHKKKDIFISQILPYLLDQLNDDDHNVRLGYCKLIISLLLEKMEVLILPYGEFCLERSLSDSDLKVKLTAFDCINNIIEKINTQINDSAYNDIFEITVMRLVNLIINNIGSFNKIRIYSPLLKEFGRLIYNLIETSALVKNWLIVYSLLGTYFSLSHITTLNLLQLKKVDCSSISAKYEIIIYFFIRFIKKESNEFIHEANINNNKLSNENTTTLEYYNSLSLYLNINQMLLHSTVETNAFDYKASRHLILTQLDSKFRLRKQIINEHFSHNTKISARLPFSVGFVENKKLNRKESIINGNYLGSLYCHKNLSNGEGSHIYQDIAYHNGDIYSWSVNSSINSGLYLHKLNNEIYNNYHSWEIITYNDENYVFKLKNNSSITSMCTLSNNLSVIVGDKNGLLTKIKLDSSLYSNIMVNEHYYNDEKKLLKFGKSIKNPSVVLIGKIAFKYRQMIMSVYSNGDVYIFDPDHTFIDFFFSVPPSLGTVVDYCLNNNFTDANWLCLLTDINIIIALNLVYLKETRIWKISTNNLITRIRTFKQSNESTKIILYLRDESHFLLFDWNNGSLISESNLIRISEIKSNLLVYSPYLYKPGLSHNLSFSTNSECHCSLCECQRIRIFRNYMAQYSPTANKFKKHYRYYHLIGPIVGFPTKCSKNTYLNNLYIFNDISGNIYQKSCVIENYYDYGNPPICIVENKDKNTIESKHTRQIHKDVLTSLSIYSLNDENFGIFTSSRDGTISYWN